MSEIRNPRFASSIRAVATAGLGRLPVNPLFMVEMISLYCCVVRATVRLFNAVHLTFCGQNTTFRPWKYDTLCFVLESP